jgi:hypothetical protein
VSRRFPTDNFGVHASVLVLLIAWSLVTFGCAKNQKQSSESPSAAPAATVAAAPATDNLVAKLPVYPGAVLATSNTGTISGKHVALHLYTTRDPFDKVYTWYQAVLPAHSEASHNMSQSQESAVFTMSSGTKQQSVSILKTGGVEVVNITFTTTGE